METKQISPRQLWAKQQINSPDVDYALWEQERGSLRQMSRISHSCIFTVDVYKERYDFASENFSHLFGYNLTWLNTIQKQGDILEERIHPDDKQQLIAYQIEHGEFIYSLPSGQRNDYRQIFQFRLLNAHQQYVNIISRQQVIRTDQQGKAWIILGIMDISPDQAPTKKVKRTIINRQTGQIITPIQPLYTTPLTNREKEILQLIRQGLLSKEIAYQLNVSIHTINNHRKNILTKLKANNTIEALNATQNLIL